MNRKIGFSTISFIVIGLICFVVYAIINKIDILSKLLSGEAFFIYLVLMIVGVLIGTEIWKMKVLGDDDDED